MLQLDNVFYIKTNIKIFIYAVAIKNKTFLKPYFIYFMKLGGKKKTTTRFAFLLKIKVALYTLKERERERRRSYIV